MSDGAEGGSSAGRLSAGPPPLAGSTACESNAEAAAHCCGCGAGNWPCCNDDPPPYASLVEQQQQSASEQHQPRFSWSYVFQGYDTGPDGPSDNRSIARPLVSIPLTSYRIFKIEPPCYAAATRQLPSHPQARIVAEVGPAVKSSSGSSRKYSALLIAATVIVFLMALSLMVRLVTDKSFWRG